jgi:hypothetical protein
VRARFLLLGGLILGALTVAPATAGAAVLYDQLPSGSFTSKIVPSFDYTNAAFKDQAADDFTVPDGQVWTIQAVDAFGAANQGASGTDTGNVFLYQGAGTAPGNLLFSQSGIALGGGSCSVPNQCDISAPVAGAPNLSPGTYWISLQTAGPYAWWWLVYPPTGTFGSPAVWQNPGNGSGRNCTTYAPLLQCGWTTASDGKDFSYRLEGNVIDSHFSLGQPKLKSRYVISQPGTFPGAGTAVVTDAAATGRAARLTTGAKKNVKKATVAVGAAGTVNLPIKLTHNAKKKLKKHKKVKLRAVITFTASGGVPFSLNSTIKLIPAGHRRAVARIAATADPQR